MKYKAIIETDEFEDFEFFEDGNGKYIHGIDAGSVNGEWIALYFTECKQEPILDKIRAEIASTGACEQEMNGKTEFLQGIDYCLAVIDRYMAESEGE